MFSKEKAKAVVEKLRAMKLKEAAKKIEDGVEEALTHCDFPFEHWTHIRTNDVIERLNREIRRRYPCGGDFCGWQLCTDAGLCQTSPCRRHAMGQQEVHEYEALGVGL